MAISRMNMERQMRNMGGIMGLEDQRQGYFLGKLVKKIGKGVKKVVKSPLGKAALLAAGAYYAGGALGGAGGLNNFSTLGSVLKKKAAGMVPEFLSGKTGTALGITALGGIFGGAMAGKSEEEVDSAWEIKFVDMLLD